MFMKKFLIAVLVFNLLAFSGCAVSFDGVEKDAEIEALSTKIDDLQKELDEKNSVEDTRSLEETASAEEKKTDLAIEDTNIEATDATSTEPAPTEATTTNLASYVGDNYITLNSPANDTNFTEEPIIFTGVVSPNTTKVVVTWEPPTNGEANDVYKLQSFNYGDSSFRYSAKVSYNNLAHGTNKYEFKAYFDDGTTKSTNIQIYYSIGGAEMGRPVIYLYPEETTKVSVNVLPQSGISVSVPEIGDGWNVIATPSGKILNISDLKVYPYLFWEGFASTFVRPAEGFVVEKVGISAFFDEKLAILGLNKKEAADFKEFWVPKLASDPYYFITFVPQKQFDKYAPLTINPAPDTIIRVFFDYQGLSEQKAVTEQKLEKRERAGFSVIEWGGRLY